MRHRWVMLLIVVMAAAFRLGLLQRAWHDPDRLFTPDTEGYVRLAAELGQTGRFELDGEPEIFRAPGYPMFLLLGAPLGESWWRGVALAQVGVDLAAVYLVYLLGTLLCRRAVGWLAAGFYAASPLAIAGSLRILSDGLFTFLLLLGVLMVVLHLRTWRTWALVAGAGAMAAACYVRPVGLWYAALIVLVLLGRAGRFKRVMLFAGVVALAVAPWVVRNAVVADYLGFSSFATDSLYYFGAPEVVAAQTGEPAGVVRGQAWEEGHELSAQLGEGAAARERASIAWDVVKDNPLLYARTHLVGSLGFWLPAGNEVLEIAGRTTGQRGTLDVLHARGLGAAAEHYFAGDRGAMWLAGGMVLLLALQYLGVLAWLVSGARWRMGAACWLGVVLVAGAALAVGASGVPRFRLPVSPLLCAAAGAGWLAIVGMFRRHRPTVAGNQGA